MDRTVTLTLDDETATYLARRATDQGRTAAEVAAQIVMEDLRRERDDATTSADSPSRSLYGVCAAFGSGPTEAEIDDTRREVWASFPRRDIA